MHRVKQVIRRIQGIPLGCRQFERFSSLRVLNTPRGMIRVKKENSSFLYCQLYSNMALHVLGISSTKVLLRILGLSRDSAIILLRIRGMSKDSTILGI